MTTTDNPPPQDITPEGEICIPLSIPADQEWIWYVAKCLKFPTSIRFWQDLDTTDIETLRNEWEARVYTPFVNQIILNQPCATVDENTCLEYPPNASFIRYEPLPYPFQGDIPAGYLQPPFFEFDEILPSLIPDFIEEWLIDASGWAGYEPTDIITAAWAFPFFANWFNGFSNGLPRFSVQVEGAGEVELHMLSVPIGGRAVIAVDIEPNIGDILNGVLSGDIIIIDTELDLSSYPPEAYNVNTVEIELPTMGSHTIYVVFMPALNADIIPIQFGGGLRKVVLCGVTPPAELETLPCEVEMNDTIKVFNNATQPFVSGAWTSIKWAASGDNAYTWDIGDLDVIGSPSLDRVQWNGGEEARFHVSVHAEMLTTNVTQLGLRLMDNNGNNLGEVVQFNETRARLAIDTDIVLQPGETIRAEVRGLTSAGNIVDTNYHTSISVHRIDQLGGQGLQGGTGDTGTAAILPPAFSTTLINAMDADTQAFLDMLESLYTDSPQDIDPNIPTGNPDATEEIALCQSIAAWLNLYIETKSAQIRSRNQLQQAWDALNSAIYDAFEGIDNVFGWSITDSVFSCLVDASSALVAFEDTQAREDIVCCLFDELKDISLTTGSFDAAISACISSLTGTAQDILCLAENDNDLNHTLMFFYLYGRALTDGVATPCPCGTGFSYLEYDFSVDNGGFSANNGDTFYESGLYWDASDSNPDPDNWVKDAHILRALPAEARVCGIGIHFDTNRSCGITTNSVKLFNDSSEVAGGGSSPGFNGNGLFRTWSFGNNENGVIGDEIRIRLLEKTCSEGNEAIARIRKVRVWFALNSAYHATSSTIAPQFLPTNGSSDSIWWQS
jgi:hypothetical protein